MKILYMFFVSQSVVAREALLESQIAIHFPLYDIPAASFPLVSFISKTREANYFAPRRRYSIRVALRELLMHCVFYYK